MQTVTGVCACNTHVFTCAADLQVDGEDGVRAGGVFVHQRVAHCSPPPALLYDPLTLGHTVHRVHGQVPDVDTALWVLLQLIITHTHTQYRSSERIFKKFWW